MTRLTLFVALLCISNFSFPQKNKPLIDSLKHNLSIATSDKDKLHWMSELVIWLQFFDSTAAHFYADEQTKLAEASRNRRFIIGALFSQINALSLKFNAGQDKVEEGVAYGEQALQIAKESNDEEYEAWADLHLADCYLGRNNARILDLTSRAVDIAESVQNDSLSIIAFIYQGDSHLNYGNKIICFRNYLKAYNAAEPGNDATLKIWAYQRLSYFYGSVHQMEKQKDYLVRALMEARRYSMRYDECSFLHQIGQVYVDQGNYKLAEEYLEESLNLANNLQYDTYKLNIYWTMATMYKLKKDFLKYQQFLNGHPELEESYLFASGNQALDKLYRKAVVLKESQRFDSAVHYYRQIEEMLAQYDLNPAYKKIIYLDFGGSLIQIGEYKEALRAYKNAERYSDKSNPVETKNMARWFDTIYHRLGDYQSAYTYKLTYEALQDSLDNLSKQDELLLKEIDNETQLNEKHKADEAEKTRRRHNIQYMGITVSIICVFIILIVMGIFSLSVRSIQALGFFAFLLLFEFIILLADYLIHSLTHGEPWKVLLIKISIAAFLLPLHHYVEEKAIHYFATRKKLKIGARKFVQDIFRGKDSKP